MDIIKRIESSSAAQTEREAESFARGLGGDETIALFGGMGMGKTAFTRGLAKGLGIDPSEVSSPTFAIVHEHSGGAKKMCHYDMYRVETWEELDSTGFFESVGRCINVVEWSENIENALPVPRWEIHISQCEGEQDGRVLEISYVTEESEVDGI